MSSRGVIPDSRTVYEDELAIARGLIALQHQLSVIAAQAREPAALTDRLARCLDAPVWLVSETGAVIARSARPGPFTDAHHRSDQLSPHVRWDRIFHVASDTRSAVRSPEVDGCGSYVVAPVLVDLEEITAFLVTSEPKSHGAGDFTLLALEHAAIVCGVMLSRGRALAAAAGRARDDLVEGLLLGRTSDHEELLRWARHLGIDAAVPQTVILLAFAARTGSTVLATEREARLSQVIRHFCESRGAGVLTVVRDTEVVAIVPDATPTWPSAPELAAECLTYCRELFGSIPLTVVVSKHCSDLGDIARAHRDVRRAADAFERLGRQGEVIALEDLGLHSLLLHVPNVDELRTFASEILGPLARYDRERGTQLLDTLVSFFRNGTSVRRVAEDLHVHPNTVTYRLKRCSELGGVDLERYQDRLALQVALEIVALVGPIGE